MYTFTSAVRYSETDETGTLTIPAMINYLQDCSLFQTEHLGVGVGHAQEVGRRWLLAAWQIEIARLPRFTEQIAVSTWARDFRGLFAGRNFTMCAADGTPLVRADSLWFMYDDASGRPVRPPAEETDPYQADLANDAPLDLPPIQRRIPFEGEGERATPIAVTRAHIDTNHHVNNAQYVDMALSALPEDVPVAKLDVQYCEAARLGDTIYPRFCAIDGGYVVGLDTECGKPYAVVRVRA